MTPCEDPHRNDPPRDDRDKDTEVHGKGPQISAKQIEFLASQVTQCPKAAGQLGIILRGELSSLSGVVMYSFLYSLVAH
jgi:hypothetical protein